MNVNEKMDNQEKKKGMTVEQFVRGFADGTLPKRKRSQGKCWRIVRGDNDTQTLVFSAYEGGTKQGEDMIAVRLSDGRFIFNAARHRWVGTRMAWGNRTRSWRSGGVEWFQNEWNQQGKMGVPFNVLTQLSLAPAAITIVEKADAETMDVGNMGQTVDNVIAMLEQDNATPEGLLEAVKHARALERNRYMRYTAKAITEQAKKLGTSDAKLFDEDGYTFNFGVKGKSLVNVRARKNKYTDSDDSFSIDIEFTLREPRHFVGACLFRVDKTYFLFDVDRNELKHGLFNPFVAVVKGEPKSIAQAYEMLKPEQVVEAEKKGLKVLRQGEWFFIPAKEPKLKRVNIKRLRKLVEKRPSFSPIYCRFVKRSKMLKGTHAIPADGNRISGEYAINTLVACGITRKMIDDYNKKADAWTAHHRDLTRALELERNGGDIRGTLKAGDNRPNRAEKFREKDGKVYVSGLITHDGREHKDLKLEGWYMAVPNTAISSFQVTGDID